MKPALHLAASSAVSVPLYLVTGSATLAVSSFLWGFLIDTDHILDYIREYGLRPDVREFFRIFHETRFRKLFLIFHAWEWVLLLTAVSLFFTTHELLTGILIGTLHHLLLDHFGNGPTKWGYFIMYRAYKQFNTTDVIRETIIEQRRNNFQGS